MNTIQQIAQLISAFDKAKSTTKSLAQLVLETMFKKRDRYIIPRPLWIAFEMSGVLTDTVLVCPRESECTHVFLFGVQYKDGIYLAHGLKEKDCRDYMVEGEWTEDLVQCASFITWWISNSMDTKIDWLAQHVLANEEKDTLCDIVDDWCRRWSFGFSSTQIDIAELIEWAKEYDHSK